MVEYKYDAWGNHEAEVASEDYVALAEINPYRYRGYYYDSETDLYFLQTRYYDPEVGRFISRDSIEYADPETICGLNLYAYCGNNPVMNVDPMGTSWWTDFWNSVVGKIVGTILVAAAVVALSILTAGVGGAVTAALGGGVLAALAGGAVGGAVSGAIFGAGLSIAIQGVSNGYGNVDWGKVGIDTLMGGLFGAVSGACFAAIGRGLGLLGKTKWAQRTLKNYSDISKNYMFGSKSGNFTFFRNGKTFRLEASIQHGLHYHSLAAGTTAPQWKLIFMISNVIAGLMGGGLGNAI